MKQSNLFYSCQKEDIKGAESVSHNLLLKSGFINQTAAGIYSFLPLGLLAVKKIEEVIRRKMKEIGGQEILMPALGPKENWQKTGRWDSFDALFKIKDDSEKEYALNPTHEEIISPLVKKHIFSYKDLPLYLFQIQTKFRNEARPKSGLLRTKEFLMKDLYSFHRDEKDLDRYYEKVSSAYADILKELGLEKKTLKVLASGGTFSKYSHEFQTLTEYGEDKIIICKKCGFAFNKEIGEEKCLECNSQDLEEKKGIEVGNIFKLGTKYSLPFGLSYKDEKGSDKPVLMGCYGMGVSRVLGAIVEVSNDQKGMILPKSISPFLVHIIRIENSPKVKKSADSLYKVLEKNNIEVLYDDRESKTAGEKFAEADLIGIPYRVVVSEKTLKEKAFELKERNSQKAKIVKDVLKHVK